MMWGYGGWVSWLGMGIGMTVFWGVIIVGVIALVRYLAAPRERHGPGGRQGDPEQVLADRFARGEFEAEEYRQRREVLRGGQ